MFAGTNTYGGSASGAAALTVTGTIGALGTATSIAETGSWGNYTLTGTVTGSGGTAAPTGTVSFLDTSNGNSVLGTGTLGSSVAGIAWPNPQSLNTTGETRFVIVADLNGDGIPDLALNDNPLVIYLGSAGGTYTEAPVPSVPGPPAGPMVIADFNGDGIPDLALAMYGSANISILLGNGDGTFAAAIEASVPGSIVDVTQLLTADVNGDGIPDLVVTDNDGSTVDILLGNGDGTFSAEANPPASENPIWIAAGDFNGDGKTDLAVEEYDGSISIFLGNGDGTFAAAGTVPAVPIGSPITTADFNGDGNLDLAVAVGGTAVTILTGNGDGTFNSPSSGQNPASTPVTSIQVADFNQDGAADVVLTDENGNATVVLNNGSGSLSESFLALTVSPPYYLAVGVGDINGDGYPDLAGAGYYQATLSILLTEPTETASATASISVAGVGQHLVNASYAGNSNYTSSASGSIPLWGISPATTTTLTLSSGGTPATSVPPGTVVTFTATVTAGTNPVTTGNVIFCDASASSCTDIHLLGTVALTNGGTATFKYVPGPGAYSYKAEFVQNGYGLGSSSAILPLTVGPAPAPVYSNTTAITESGFPGDYSLTATVVGFGGSASPTGNVSFLDTSFGNNVLATAPLGTGTAGIGWLISQTPAAGNNLLSEVQGDFNGDGIPDLAVLWTNANSTNNSNTAAVTILFGNGDGTFTAGPTTQSTITSDLQYFMIGGDFNGDGKADLALLSYSISANFSDSVTTFLGKGDGTFTISAPSTVYNQGSVGGDFLSGSMVAADFNGDGKLDLAVVGDYINSGGVTVVLGNGDGTFTAAGANLDLNADFGLIATGDFNGDGIPDLVATNYFGPGGATIFLGKGDGTFAATATPLAIVSFPSSIVAGDFNGDGKLDLAIGYDGSVEVFLGNGDGTFNQTSGSPLSGGAT